MKKDLYKKYFEGKRITMMGLGLLGRGLGDALFLTPLASQVVITDKKSETELKTSIETLKNKLASEDFDKIKFVLGEHREEDFVSTDIVMKSPSVPLDSLHIKLAKDNNIPVYMSAAILVKIVYENLPNVKVIGITGTRGKSTATMMICHMLEVAGKKVHLGGNARGVVSLPLLDEIEDGDYLVLELDSWQLQGFGDLKISPQVAVFTSFLDDHLNYYKGDRQAYFNDKANIFLNQKDDDRLIISKDVEEKINNFCFEKKINRNITIGHTFLQNMNLIGYHNQVIAGLVNEVGIALGLDYDDIVKGISTFEAVEGRLQYLGVFQNNVHVYNDNNATTPDATVVGVIALNEKYNRAVTLICGGADKQLDLSRLVEVIIDPSRVSRLILLAGTGTEVLKSELSKLGSSNYEEYGTMRECVNAAMHYTKADSDSGAGVLLYSPGFASFSKYFNNEYEKNDEFLRSLTLGA